MSCAATMVDSKESHAAGSPAASPSISRRLIAGLLFGFLVLLAMILVGDLRQLTGQIMDFRWSLFPWVLGLTLINYLLRFIKWHYYLLQIGVRNLPVPESARLFVAGFPLAVTPGKVGEGLKGLWLNQKTGVSTARGISVVVAERISDGLGVLALSTLGVIAYPQYWPAFAIVLAILLAAILISQIRPLALSLIDLAGRLPFIKRFAHGLHEFYEGSFALFKPRATLIAVSIGTISWFAEGVGFYLILLGLGLPPSGETLSIAVFVLSFSTVVGAVSALPGGLGAAEASIVGMLVLTLGLGADSAAAATLLIRFATLWFAVVLGLLVWSFSGDLFIREKAEGKLGFRS
jgi:glycosyltransferase 2 family protein